MYLHREVQRLEIRNARFDQRRNAVVHAALHVVIRRIVVLQLSAIGVDVAILMPRVKIRAEHPFELQRAALLVAAAALLLDHRKDVLAILAARRLFFFKLKQFHPLVLLFSSTARRCGERCRILPHGASCRPDRLRTSLCRRRYETSKYKSAAHKRMQSSPVMPLLPFWVWSAARSRRHSLRRCKSRPTDWGCPTP